MDMDGSSMLEQGYVDVGYGAGGGATMLADNTYVNAAPNDNYNCAAAATVVDSTDGGKFLQKLCVCV